MRSETLMAERVRVTVMRSGTLVAERVRVRLRRHLLVGILLLAVLRAGGTMAVQAQEVAMDQAAAAVAVAVGVRRTAPLGHLLAPTRVQALSSVAIGMITTS